MDKEIEIGRHYKCFLRVIDKCTGRVETIDTKAVIVGDDKIEFTLELNKLSTENQRIIDLTHENKILAKALELMSLVLCTGAREDLRSKINKFAWREDVVKFFKQQAEKELKDE